MGAPAAGAVVLVQFPFSDLSRTKLRPAVVLADAGRGDYVLCQVTSKPYGDSRAVKLEDASLVKVRCASQHPAKWPVSVYEPGGRRFCPSTGSGRAGRATSLRDPPDAPLTRR